MKEGGPRALPMIFNKESTMKTYLRKSTERGAVNIGWLDSRFSFSFDQYYDPKHMGFRHLRVINHDRIMPDGGFPTHPHQNMEIITYMIRGALEHKDSMGNTRRIEPGQIQRMSAGSGITHSEYNPSSTEETELYQIWIYPKEKGIKPTYEELDVPSTSGLHTLLSSESYKESTSPLSSSLHQEAVLYMCKGEGEHTLSTQQNNGHFWVQAVKGQITIQAGEETFTLEPGDGLGLEELNQIKLTSNSETESLIFDLP